MQQETESNLDGLWVVLVDDAETGMVRIEGRVPMMARAGDDQTYLLGFKNVISARHFLSTSSIEDAEPRMVVKGNKDQFLSAARQNGVVGILVDYDPSTQEYSAASAI